MVQFVGTYKFVSQEGVKEYLLALGVPEDQAAKISEHKENAVISAVDKDSVTAEYGGNSVKFPLNKEVEHVVATGIKVRTTTTLQDDGIIFKTKLNEDGSVSEEKVLKISGDDLTVTSTNTKGAKSVRKYKRV